MDAPRLALLTRGCAGVVTAALGACVGTGPQEPMPAPGQPQLQMLEEDAEPSPVEGRLALSLGYRRFADRLGSSGRDHVAVALDGDIRPRDWPIGIEAMLGISGIEKDSPSPYIESVDSSAREFSIGGRLTLDLLDPLVVLVGAGGTAFSVDAQQVPAPFLLIDDDDSTFSPYGHVALCLHVSEEGYAFLDGRTVWENDVTLFGQRVEADYWQITFGIGARF